MTLIISNIGSSGSDFFSNFIFEEDMEQSKNSDSNLAFIYLNTKLLEKSSFFFESFLNMRKYIFAKLSLGFLKVYIILPP